MTTPSSSSVREIGGVEPGVMPPISAWWPRLPTKNRISRPAVVEHRRDDGDVGQMRAAVERIVQRHDVARLQRVAPRCAARCARSRPSRRDAPARAARWPPGRPSASKMAQEKSSRSLMLTLSEVFCSTAPVCSATFMNRLLNSSSSTGSGRSLPAGDARRRAARCGAGSCGRAAVTSAVQPGSTTVVALASRISAGPAMRSPASSAVRSNTGASMLGAAGEHRDAVDRLRRAAVARGERRLLHRLARRGRLDRDRLDHQRPLRRGEAEARAMRLGEVRDDRLEVAQAARSAPPRCRRSADAACGAR